MKKCIKFLLFAQLTCLLVLAGMLVADKITLSNDLIRLHVVAASDSAEDQRHKLLVRDAIVAQAEVLLAEAETAEEACRILTQSLTALTETANRVLLEEGSHCSAAVTLQKEAFPVRHYDTFSLPSGVYQSLRVNIGEAKGENWWCVVFPSLCMEATSHGTADVAAASGFSNSLNRTLTGEAHYEISFFFLDCIGKLENLLFS